MTDLAGAVVLVVGAAGGLGQRLSARLTSAGATVVEAGRRGEGALRANLREAGAAASLVRSAVDTHGRLDGLVIAAGVVAFGGIDELEDETLRELVQVNATAPIELIRSAWAPLAESAAAGRSPFVVTLSGIVAEAPTAGLAAYSASKAALHAFTVAGAREARRAGIRLVDARPGHTETELSAHPIAGTAPAFPPGLDPDAVVDRIVTAIIDGERDLPSTSFA